MAKGLKSIDPSQQSRIENLLMSKDENLSKNAVADIVNSIHKNSQKRGGKDGEDGSIEDSDDEELSSESDDDPADASPLKEEEITLVENVRDNIEKIFSKSNLKRKASKKRWWTPEEVS